MPADLKIVWLHPTKDEVITAASAVYAMAEGSTDNAHDLRLCSHQALDPIGIYGCVAPSVHSAAGDGSLAVMGMTLT